MSKTVLFQAIQFSKITQFSSIWSIYRALSGTTIPGQIGPGSYGNEGVLRIPQSSNITGASSSDCLVSYPGHLLERGSYPSAEVQSMYSTVPADWAIHRVKCKNSFISYNLVEHKYAVYMSKQFYFEQFNLA